MHAWAEQSGEGVCFHAWERIWIDAGMGMIIEHSQILLQDGMRDETRLGVGM
jgi:hypothetical protein